MTALRLFRGVGFLEAISFLVLLFIAMPLKYVWHLPLAVRVVGIAHGVLFVLYVSLVFHVGPARDWSLKTMALAVVAAFLPFGPFVFDRHIRDDPAKTAP